MISIGSCSQMRALALLTLSCSVLVFAALPADGGDKPADTLQSFGVGVRADSIGDAYVAVANDATATFWNPAGLALLENGEATLALKSMPEFSQETVLESVGDPLDFNFDLLAERTDSDVGSLGPSFLGVAIPLGRPGSRSGTIGLSYARAGFFERQWLETQVFPVQGQTLQTLTSEERKIDHYTLAYGWRASRDWAVGAGAVLAQSGNEVGGLSRLGDTPDIESLPWDPIDPIDDSGTGVGFIVGTIWTPTNMCANGASWNFGLSYRSKISFSDLGISGDVWGDEQSDRLLFGAAYNKALGKDAFLLSAQVARFGSANKGFFQEDRRDDVWNFHLGAEYSLNRSQFSFPIRLGLLTNSSPDSSRFDDDTWVTFGLGAVSADKTWQADFGLQLATHSDVTVWSLGGTYRFDSNLGR